MDDSAINIGSGGLESNSVVKVELLPDCPVPLIDPHFLKSGGLYDFLNDMATVRDREIKRKCEIKERFDYE